MDTAERVKKMMQSGASAAQVAAALDVSKATAYTHIKALRKKYGGAIAVQRVRISAHGPKTRVYTMRSER